MIMNKKNILIAIVMFIGGMYSKSYSQEYINPVENVPVSFSANFGELRANHFHSGLDFKTQQVINKPIVSVADGYVSRISVSPGGYGLALYVTHEETGHTTVYGHLNSFVDNISRYVKEQQYAKESFRVELYPEKGMFVVKQGEQIALSGNTGGSGGPHLHFEVRDTKSQDPIDPLIFYDKYVTDSQVADLRGIAIYPIVGKGIVNGENIPIRLNVSKNNQGVPMPPAQTITAWGRIGVGVKAYDKMNGQQNIYGVKHVRLYVDDKRVFSQTIDRFSFDNTRMLNSLTDYEDWRLRNSFYMKSFVEQGNLLPFYDTVNKGYIDIVEERNYMLRYELEDHHGNVLKYPFVVTGKKQSVDYDMGRNSFMSHNFHNTFIDTNFLLDIPRQNLYTDIYYSHSRIEDDKYSSDIFQVNNKPVPLNNSAKMWIRLSTDTLSNKKQYGIVDLTGRTSWVGGVYKNGGMEINISELGRRYAITYDNMPPVITPINPANWKSNRKIQVRLSDNLSGIAYFRGTINGEYVLFTHDTKSPIYTYDFDDTRLSKGEKLLFVFTTIDGVGNESRYEYVIE